MSGSNRLGRVADTLAVLSLLTFYFTLIGISVMRGASGIATAGVVAACAFSHLSVLVAILRRFVPR